MSNFRFLIKERRIRDSRSLWSSVKKIIQSLPDGSYVWPHPGKQTGGRSTQQNRYYWGVVCKLISDHTGYTPEEIHQILSKKFLKYVKNNEEFTISTTKLKTSEFEAYMEDCRRWAEIELKVYIPLPNEQGNFFYDI